jgi:predicted transcriptional regulator
MDDKKLGFVESKFADIIWQHEPISSGELVKRCEAELRWKKPTTYTVLRRLCERGIFQNEGGTVRSLISREEFYALQSERFVEENFSGDLPSFLAAFTRRRSLSADEIAEIRKMIDSYGEV